jgi:hypothetical protein
MAGMPTRQKVKVTQTHLLKWKLFVGSSWRQNLTATQVSAQFESRSSLGRKSSYPREISGAQL